MELGKVTVGRLVADNIIIENNTIKKNSGHIILKLATGYSRWATATTRQSFLMLFVPRGMHACLRMVTIL